MKPSTSPMTGYTILILPIAVQELILAVWLLVEGFKPSPPGSAAPSQSQRLRASTVASPLERGPLR